MPDSIDALFLMSPGWESEDTWVTKIVARICKTHAPLNVIDLLQYMLAQP